MALQAFVCALVDGIFNDPDHRAQEVHAGDYLTVAGGWYVESLEKDGFVVVVSKEEYYRRMSEAERRERIEGINEGGAIMHDWHEGQNMQGIGPHLTKRLAELNPPSPIAPTIDPAIVQLANDLDELDAAFDLLDSDDGPDPYVIAQDQALVEPDLNPQPVDEAFLVEMTAIAQANGEYDLQPPPVAPPTPPAAPPGRIPESKVVKANAPEPRKLVPENQGRRRRG